jgi:hypothetical protein
VQIVDDGAPTQIEEILAQAAIPGTSSLPLTYMSQGMLDRDPFAQFGSSLRRVLALTQLDEQGFIGMNADTTAFDTGRALLFERTLCTDLFRKMDHPTGYKGHVLLSRAPNHLPFPI